MFKVKARVTKKMRIDSEAIRRAQKPTEAMHPAFQLQKPPPGVLPAGATTLAMDDAISGQYAWAASMSRFSEGIGFMGYPYLAELTQRSEYRKISETIAKEMTRKWIKLQSTGDDSGKEEKLKQIEAEMKRLKVQSVFREVAELDGFFGRAHVYLDTGDGEDPDELKTTLGTGASEYTKYKVNPQHPLKRLEVIEPVWTYPNAYNASDPLRLDYFRPTSWFVQGRLLHSTRLLTFIGREVPDLLKPAYSFGGLSLSQMAKPYVDNWLRTRQSVSNMIYKFSTSVLKTNMGAVLQGGSGADTEERVKLFEAYRDNHGVLLLDMTSEEFIEAAKPLGSLDKLQAQAQEHMSACSGIPLVKLLGITPSGLNASSDGEMRCFYDWIESMQESTFTDHLSTIINLIQFSLYGFVDPEIGFKWEPLWTLDDAELSAVRKQDIDSDVAAINAGIILPQEARVRLASEEDSPYASLDLDVALPPPPGSVPPGGPENGLGGQSDDPASPDAGGGMPANPFTAKTTPESSQSSTKTPGGVGSAGGNTQAVGKATGAKDEWNSQLHPRGQPENAGEFGPGGGGAKHAEGGISRTLGQEFVSRTKVPNGGFSYNVRTKTEPKEGLILSIYPEHSVGIRNRSLTKRDMVAYIVKNAKLLRQPGNHFGGWRDPDFGTIYLDVSMIVPEANPDEAKRLCLQHRQKGYFNLRTKEYVEVDKNADSGGA